jgi:hypothetical protein
MTTAEDVTLNGMTDATESEALPDLTELADEPGGAWKPGWYAATIIEGYATPKGKQFATEDVVSQKGDSRNLRLCVSVHNGADSRNVQEVFNYRPSDLTPERLAYIKEARAENKGVQGRWTDTDAQRSSLAIGKLGQITKAVGFGFKRAGSTIITAPLVSQNIDVRVAIDENGYNVITGFAPAGTKAPKRA